MTLGAPARRALCVAVCGGVLTAYASEASAQEKYALAMFHFNVQYVAGGTIGYLGNEPDPILDQDNDAIEDRIITESLAPVIELYEKHPTWGVDIEMQAYMLDIIAWRHPALLDKMRTMAKSGQIDVLSFHYSDQLFIGYPTEDWARSQTLTAETFARHDIPLSTSVFCQEGQAARNMAGAMAERGYEVMIWPKNLWRYQHGDLPAAPLYRFGDIHLVQGAKGATYSEGGTDIEMRWTFFDDGELLATNDVNPYFPEVFYVDQASVDAYEDELVALENDGWDITTVREYAAAVQAAAVPLADTPSLLDGTWQPDSTFGVKRWLGGAGIFKDDERDNHVRTVGAQAHREMVAAETIAEVAGIDARAPLDAAWRLLFLGQVTDASGINPFEGEVYYGIAHMNEAMRIARDVIRDAKDALGNAEVVIDPSTATVRDAGDTDPFTAPGEPASAPVDATIETVDRTFTETWDKLGEGHYRLTVTFDPVESNKNPLGVRFRGPLEDDVHVGLAFSDEAPTLIRRSDFVFETFHFALPTGLISIGGGWYVIKDMAQVHLAAEMWRDAGEVLFEDQTAPVDDRITWVFHLVEGTPEQAAVTANDLNVRRSLTR